MLNIIKKMEKKWFRFEVKYLFLLFFFSSCSDSSSTKDPIACRGNFLIGTWINTLDTLTISEDCSAHSSYCDADIDFPSDVLVTDEIIPIIVNRTLTKAECLSAKIHACSSHFTQNSLSLTCGELKIEYVRK